jgi:hypothetical protein
MLIAAGTYAERLEVRVVAEQLAPGDRKLHAC